MSILMTGCAESKPDAAVEKETLSSCNVKLSNIQFTQAKNGAENNVTVFNDTLKFVAGPQTISVRRMELPSTTHLLSLQR